MSQENVSNQEAIEKIKSLAKDIDICMFCTDLSKPEFEVSPMSTQEVDEDGNIWFLSSAASHRNSNIESNNQVILLYAHPGEYNFMKVMGKATISRDKEKIDKYWNKFVEAWFEKGKDDPDVTIIKVAPNDAYYWDNKTNKLVTFFKVAAAAISGSDMDLGREGKISL